MCQDLGKSSSTGWWGYHACVWCRQACTRLPRCDIYPCMDSLPFFSVPSLYMMVQYETLVDKYARQKKRRPEYEMKTFYGQLQHIFVVSLPSDARLSITEPAIHILASIRTCKVERSNPVLDIHYYSKLGGLDILDITCIQCVVGRIPCANNSWAIIDRSGDLARAFYVPETGDE